MHSSDNTQKLVPFVHNKQFNVGGLVHLCCERRRFVAIKSGESHSKLITFNNRLVSFDKISN